MVNTVPEGAAVASANTTWMPVVAAALVDAAGRVLVQQRPAGKALAGLWEFPGGKVESGEAPEAALVRELAEELGITVVDGALAPLTFASTPLGDRHLVLLLYLCRRWTGEPQALDAAALLWRAPSELRDLAMPPADLPFIAMLERALTPSGTFSCYDETKRGDEDGAERAGRAGT